MLEEYNGFQIKINRVPEEKQFDFDEFGWAYQIFKDSKLLFRLVIKAMFGRDESTNIQYLYNWGFARITSMIDTIGFEVGRTYCYKWIEESLPPKKLKCEGFLWDDL